MGEQGPVFSEPINLFAMMGAIYGSDKIYNNLTPKESAAV